MDCCEDRAGSLDNLMRSEIHTFGTRQSILRALPDWRKKLGGPKKELRKKWACRSYINISTHWSHVGAKNLNELFLAPLTILTLLKSLLALAPNIRMKPEWGSLKMTTEKVCVQNVKQRYFLYGEFCNKYSIKHLEHRNICPRESPFVSWFGGCAPLAIHCSQQKRASKAP